jgi:hypothetical protein
MKRNLLLLWVLWAVTHLAYAQPRHGHKHHAKHPEMRKEIQEYARQNVMPIMRQQRLKLDASLSAEEKNTIAIIREELKAERKAMHQKRKEFKKMKENGSFDEQKARSEMKPIREKHKANMEKLRAIAEKYEAQIIKLREEIKPQIDTWKSEVEKIATKYVDNEEIDFVKHKIGKHWRMKGAGFLLLPTEEPKRKGREEAENAEIYPNPAQETQQLKIKLKEAGLVRIDIYDRSGNRVQTVFEGNKTAGEHLFEVNTSRLATGNYTYQISTPTDKTTKKLVKK